MATILDTLTQADYDAIVAAWGVFNAASWDANAGYGPDWGAIAVFRDAEAAFEAACENAGVDSGEVADAL